MYINALAIVLNPVGSNFDKGPSNDFAHFISLAPLEQVFAAL